MSAHAFRFVHAADLHLEQVVTGLPEIPQHLRELLLEAHFLAAERVVETVLEEEADFLVLSGDVIGVRRAGAFGPRFLAEQFDRLAERKVAVYWAGGEVDPPAAWPEEIALPDNVRRFGDDRTEEHVHHRHGVPLARVIGLSGASGESFRPDDFVPDVSGLYTIAVAHAQPDADVLKESHIRYWALGGRHRRKTLFSGAHTAVHAGTPQGRSPQESGAHGCLLVDVDEQGQTRTSVRHTDLVRWQDLSVEVNEETSPEALRKMLAARLADVKQSSQDLDLLIRWTVEGTGPLLDQLRRGPLAEDLLKKLRKEFGYGPPALWSVSLEPVVASSWPETWYDQDTILGAFLRTVRERSENEDSPLGLTAYVPEEFEGDELARWLLVHGDRERKRLLREVASLGVDLLGGHDS